MRLPKILNKLLKKNFSTKGSIVKNNSSNEGQNIKILKFPIKESNKRTKANTLRNNLDIGIKNNK